MRCGVLVMSITLRHSGLPSGFGKNDLLGLVRAIRPALNLSTVAVNLLVEVILRTQEQDYGAGQICCAWPSVDTLSADFGKSPRTINRAENDLKEAGLIARTSMTNGHRFGSREKGKDGVILRAAGINLRPLIERFDELCALRDRIQLERNSIRACRDEIKDVMKSLRQLDGLRGDARIREILPRERPSEVKDYKELVAVRDALVSVREELAAAIHQPKMADEPETNGRPYTKKETISKPCTKGRGFDADPADANVSLGQALVIATTEFKEKAELYASANGGVNWAVMAAAARETCNELGISQDDWHETERRIGSYVATLSVIVIERNHRRGSKERYHLADPRAAFAGLQRLGQAAAGRISRLAGPMLRDVTTTTRSRVSR